MSTNKLNMILREETGKGAARELRRSSRVPAIIYGAKGETKISFEQKELVVEYNKGGFLAKLYELTDGKKKFKVVPREIQMHPVKDTPLHADFLEVEDNTEVKVRVRVEFINRDKSPGIKKGGILGIVRHKVELKCAASKIPNLLTVDLGECQIGESIHISAVDLPVGVVPTIDRDFTIATIAGRGGSDSDDLDAPVLAESDDEESEGGEG